MNPQEYETNWNLFSWELAEAITSFYALTGLSDWQKEKLSPIDRDPSIATNPHFEAVIVFSNAIIAHFFIASCRIRETTNSRLSLPCFREYALAGFKLREETLTEIDRLLEKTKASFEKLKKIRGMKVAHLHNGESPFSVMRREGITREIVETYLRDCALLYSILGHPINQSPPADIERFSRNHQAVYSAFSALCGN